MLIRILFVYLFVFSISSCGESYSFNQSQRVTDSWQKDDPIRFEYDGSLGKDSIFQIGISHTGEYAYQNLYVRLIAEDDVDTILDTISSIEFTDGAGLWIGDNAANNWTVMQKLPLNTSQRFSLSIYPFGRVKEINEITSISLVAK